MGLERGGRLLGGAGGSEGVFDWKGGGAGGGDAAVALAGGAAGAGLGGRGGRLREGAGAEGGDLGREERVEEEGDEDEPARHGTIVGR